MSHLSPALRKAAVLIAALDERAAEAILQQMSTDDAAKVRSALVELDDVPPDEQRHVLAEFLREQGAPALAATADDEVALELDPAIEAAASVSRAEAPVLPTTEPSFDFLRRVDPKAIAIILNHEHPQTVAVVVAHLPPEHAAAVLEELPAPLATEALERTAWLDAIVPEIQIDLARELRQQLASHLNTAQAAPESLARLTAVLGAMDHRQRQRVVLQLGERNTSLLQRLGLSPANTDPMANCDSATLLRYRLDSQRKRVATVESRKASTVSKDTEAVWLTFDDLLVLDDSALRAVLAAADPDLAILALTGAEPRLIARIQRKLPARDAALFRHRLEHPGPVRLRDIKQARAALAAIATRLAHEGSITLPESVRFAAAA